MPLNPVPAYPTALDALPDPTQSTYTDDDGFELDLLLQKHNAIVEALENKLGIGADVAAVNELLVGTGANASAWRKLLNADVDAAAAIAYSKLALTGAIVAADMLAGAHYKKIGEVVGTGASAALVIGSIPGTYRSLFAVGKLRGTGAASNVTVTLFLNGDGSGIYDEQDHQSITSGLTVIEARSQAGMTLGHAADSTSLANAHGELLLWLPEYASGGHKNVHAETYVAYTTGGSGQIAHRIHGRYASTSAISTIDVRADAGNWDANSRLTLWGLPA